MLIFDSQKVAISPSFSSRVVNNSQHHKAQLLMIREGKKGKD